MKPDIATTLNRIRLRTPTILSAGILGISAATLRRAVDFGAGAVVTKSVGVKPRAGHPGPNIVEAPSGLLNAMGLPNPGIRQMSREIQRLADDKVTVIASVYGFSPRDYALVACEASSAGALAVELNISCPTVGKIGREIGQDVEMVAKTVRAVKAKVDRPVFVKLSPNVTDIVEIAEASARSGADGVTAINTVRGMAIDVETMMPVLGAKVGGLSGPAIKPIALRCVYELYKSLKIPIVGCGGIVSWKDAVEFLLAGATSVQIGTGVMHRGLTIFKEVNEGIASYMRNRRFQRLQQLVGLAHRR